MNQQPRSVEPHLRFPDSYNVYQCLSLSKWSSSFVEIGVELIIPKWWINNAMYSTFKYKLLKICNSIFMRTLLRKQWNSIDISFFRYFLGTSGPPDMLGSIKKKFSIVLFWLLTTILHQFKVLLPTFSVIIFFTVLSKLTKHNCNYSYFLTYDYSILFKNILSF